MALINYQNKVALNENPEIPDINKVTDDDMNQIKNTVNANETKLLVAVADSAPAQCSQGDKYFNTTTNLIYTATGTNTWGNTGVSPTLNTIYIVLSEQKTYAFNGTTLISVGGGSSAGGENLPVGSIFPFSGTTAPNNYMICDGSAISRTTYADLFNLIGTAFGSGDGSTTFNLPDLRERVPVGYKSGDSDFGTLGQTGGSKYLQEHSHTYIQTYADGWTYGDGERHNVRNTEQTISTGNAGTGNSGNLQPYQVVNFIIKVVNTTPTMANVVDGHGTSTSDAYSQNYCNNTFQSKCTNLYYNANGTQDNITLNNSATNYTYIDIFFKNNDGYEGFVKVYNPNNKIATLFSCASINGESYISNKNVQISGTSITKLYASGFYISANSVGGSGSSDNIYITRVDGWK